MDTVDYGTRTEVKRPPVLNGTQRVEIVQTIVVGLVVMVLVAIIAFPFTYYVATVIPTQHEQMQQRWTLCLEKNSPGDCQTALGGRPTR